MEDSLLNFSDLSDTSYTGLTDTATGFTGSSTFQDVQLGAPLQLDTSLGPSDASVTDFLSPVQTTTYSMSPQDMAQSLTGASQTPPSTASMLASTSTPNQADMNSNSAAGLSALSKFGAGVASLFAGQPKTVSPARPVTASAAGGILPSTAISGSMTLVLVVVVGALILLLLRSD
jgi:hypothetical protein